MLNHLSYQTLPRPAKTPSAPSYYRVRYQQVRDHSYVSESPKLFRSGNPKPLSYFPPLAHAVYSGFLLDPGAGPCGPMVWPAFFLWKLNDKLHSTPVVSVSGALPHPIKAKPHICVSIRLFQFVRFCNIFYGIEKLFFTHIPDFS